MGTCHQPHSALFSELALRAVGATRGCPGGAPLAWVCGAWGQALCHPRPFVLLGVRPGPNTHWLWLRGVRVWGPVTNPTARTLACWLGALWERHEVARGGRLLPRCGASGVGHSPIPTTLPFRRAAGAHYPRAVDAGGAGVGPCHQPHSARSCELALRVVGAGMRVPGGGRLLPGCGASGVGRSPTPEHSSFRACGRGPLTTGCGCGGCGHGAPSPTPPRALLRAGFARCGGGMRVPEGGRLLPGCGASGVGRSPLPDHSSFRAFGRGPLPTGCGCGGCGRGAPSPTPQRALLRAGFGRCGVA